MKACPFTIIVDSNEQVPYTFDGMTMKIKREIVEVEVPTVTKRLPVKWGDYMIVGWNGTAVEKKEDAAELYATMGNREHFEDQIATMSFMFRSSSVIIGSTWDEIFYPLKYHQESNWRSKYSPRSMFGTIPSWIGRYPNVHWWAVGNRRLAELICFEVLEKAWRHEQERKREAARGKELF